ncbi:MAG: TIGR04283 family arsenosugar biosynthesis glycosyltransferase [Pseudonocardia sp.]
MAHTLGDDPATYPGTAPPRGPAGQAAMHPKAGNRASDLTVSIIVPVLDEETRIESMLARLGRDFPGCEVVVVDGGSTDATPDLVHPPARLVRSARGRGPQLNAGAAHSNGEVLWIHHADTSVDPAGLGQLRAVLADPAVVGGGLTLRFDRRTPSLDYVAATSNARARRLHWIFGDQAMFVRRSAFDALGGFPDLPVMEDLEFSRRLARTGPTVLLPATCTASARRFTEHGTLRMLVFMQWLKLRYFTGADPAVLARRYAAGPRQWHRRTRSGEPARPHPPTPTPTVDLGGHR